MKVLKALSISMALAVIFGMLPRITWAIPGTELTYTEIALGEALWQYEYTVKLV